MTSQDDDQQHRRIARAYTALGQACKRAPTEDDRRTIRNPTLTEHYTFFAAITPELHGKLNEREHRNLLEHIARYVHALQEAASPQDELLSHASLLVLAPCFGLPREPLLPQLKAYERHLVQGSKSFAPNLLPDNESTGHSRKDTAGAPAGHDLSRDPALRTHTDKYRVIHEAAPLCCDSSRSERNPLKRRVRECLERQLRWFNNDPPTPIKDAKDNHLWTLYLGLYHCLSVLPPAVGLDIRDELWPNSPFLKNPLHTYWRDNYGGDLPDDAPQQKP